MVCFGWAARDGEVRTATQYFDGDREAVRYQAVQYALQGVLQMLAD
jgi:nicotinamide-nucleotide amidase